MPKSSNKGKRKLKSRGPVLVNSKGSSPKPPSKRPLKAQSLVRKDAALRRLGITKDALEVVPQITDMLKSAFKNVKAAIGLLRFSNDTAAVEFFKVYDELPAGDRDYLPIEAVCLKASVTPSALLGATFLACKVVRGQESALIAVNAHPDVMAATVKYAQEPGGDRWAKMLHEGVGFLPTPKGGNINVNLLGGNPVHGNPNRASEPSVPELQDENFGDLFPSVNQNLEKWADNRRKLLEASN